MQKIKKRVKINDYLFWNNATIDQIRQDLDELEKLGATHIEVNYYHDDGIEITAIQERYETDEEFNQRVEEIKAKNALIEIRELEQLQKLKAKYNL